jgi:hypothetical protein
LKTEATLSLSFSDTGARRSLAAVLAPDNRELPRGLSLRTGGGPTIMRLAMGSESPSTTLSTALAFLRDIVLFQEVWLLSHGKGGRVRRTDSS